MFEIDQLADALIETIRSAVKQVSDRVGALEGHIRELAVKPGPQGVPGRDGTLEQLKVSYDGERTLTLLLKNGDPIEGGVIHLPIVLDQGIYKPDEQYNKGDGVTFGGSYWIAQGATNGVKPGLPGEESRVWRLAVKSGREGREGKPGAPGPQGPRGEGSK